MKNYKTLFSVLLITVFTFQGSYAQITIEGDWKKYYIVTVSEGYNYDSLVMIGKQIATNLNVPHETLGRIFDTQRGLILPDTSSDIMYAGKYYPRRYEEKFVSVEMKSGFCDLEEYDKKPDDTKMMVVAGVFLDKKKAYKVLKLLKSDFLV